MLIDNTSASVSKAKNDADQWGIQQDRNPPEPPTAENIFTLTHINPDVNTWTEVDTTLMWTDGEKSINAATMLTFLEELVGNDLIDWSLISVDEQGIVGPDDQTTFKQILKDIDISIEKIEEPLLNEDGSPITIEISPPVYTSPPYGDNTVTHYSR